MGALYQSAEEARLDDALRAFARAHGPMNTIAVLLARAIQISMAQKDMSKEFLANMVFAVWSKQEASEGKPL